MSLQTMHGQFGSGGKDLSRQGKGGLHAILKELRGFRIDVFSGANAGDVIFPGIRTVDTILFALGIDVDASGETNQIKDLTSAVACAAPNRITCTGDLSGYRIVLFWYDEDETTGTTTTTTTTTTSSSTTTTSSTTSTTSSTSSTTTTTTTTTAP